MNVGARAKLMVMIGLAMLTGLSAIALPAVLTGFQNPSPQGLKTNTNSTGATNWIATGSTTATGPANSTRTQQAPMGTGLTIPAFSILVSIIVIPALALAFFTSSLAARRGRAKFEQSLESATS